MKLLHFNKLIVIIFLLLPLSFFNACIPSTQVIIYNNDENIGVDESFKTFLKIILQDSLERNQEQSHSNALLRCIERSFDDECTTMPFVDLADALPELTTALVQLLKAPRPSLFGAGFSGASTCNLSGVISALIALQQKINQCCQAQLACCAELESDFQQTWTILANIGTVTASVDLSTVFTALAACCTTLESDFQQTWTILSAGFNGTFSAINTISGLNLNGTYSAIAAGFNGTFSALNACCNNINSEFQQTWTILGAGFHGTFSAIAAINTEANGTFSSIAACCNATFSAIADLKTTITNDFAQTWTILAAGFNGTFSAINAISASTNCNGTFSALAACCNATFSAIADVKNTMTNDFAQTWTILAAGFNGTFSAIAAINTESNSTFSALAACCNATFSAIADLKTTITNDFAQTWTILAAGFNGTFSSFTTNIFSYSVISDLKATMSTDFYQTWTILGAGFNGTFSALAACCNGTFSAIADLKATLSTDMYQTWTILAAGFNGTFSVIADLKATLSTDFYQTWTLETAGFNGTFSMLNQVLENQGCSYTAITQALVVPPMGYTISQPGNYILTENISFSPSTVGTSAINIEANNVLLNLGCYNITQGNSTGDTQAIVIAPGQSNVSITNGTISNMTGDAILVEFGSSNINISNMTISSCDDGIYFYGTNGITIFPITTFFMNELDLIGNGFGIYCYAAQGGYISNCSIINTTTAGISFVNSYSNTVSNCSIENTNATSGSTYGIYAYDGGNNKFSNCYIDNVSTADTSSTNSANGIFIGANENGDTITNNTISNVSTSSSALPFGIHMDYTFTALSNSLLPTVSLNATINGLAWSPGGRYLATASNTGVAVYELTNNNLINVAAAIDTNGQAFAVSWSPDSSYLAVMDQNNGSNGRLTVYGFGGGQFGAFYAATASANTASNFNCVSWSPDGKYIIVSGFQNSAVIYQFNPTAATPLTLFADLPASFFGGSANAECVHWCPTNPSLIAVGGTLNGAGGAVNVIQIKGTAVNLIAQSIFTFATNIGSVRWSSDGQKIAVGSNDMGGANTEAVQVYTFNGTTLTAGPSFTHGSVTATLSVAWSPDNNYIVIGGGVVAGVDTRVLLYTGTSLNLISNYSHGATVNSVDWSSKGDLIAIGGVRNAGFQAAETLSGLQFPSEHRIMNNSVSTVNGPAISNSSSSTNSSVSSGRGIFASSGANLIIENTAFSSDLNYTFVDNIFTQYVSNTGNQFLSTISNLSFPPL